MMLSRAAALLTLPCLIALLTVRGSVAGDEHKHDQKAAGAGEAEMAAWMKANAPGAHHKHFADYVGEWDAQVRTWESPGSEPMVSAGTSTYEVIMGGRFLKQTFHSTMMGMPFEGLGLSGFDNTTGKHTVMWIDNMNTQMMYSAGDCSDHCRTETHVTTLKDPMTGRDVKVKMVTRRVDENKHIFEYYMAGDGGEMFKTMEITYTRG